MEGNATAHRASVTIPHICYSLICILFIVQSIYMKWGPHSKQKAHRGKFVTVTCLLNEKDCTWSFEWDLKLCSSNTDVTCHTFRFFIWWHHFKYSWLWFFVTSIRKSPVISPALCSVCRDYSCPVVFLNDCIVFVAQLSAIIFLSFILTPEASA